MMIGREQILSYLPHRRPFLFIDSVENISLPGRPKLGPIVPREETVGMEVTARYALTGDHVIFQGHFPSDPILPGVIQIEMMAQAAGFSMFYCFEDPEHSDIRMALLSVKNAKFRRPVIPDVNLTITSKVLRVRGAMVSHRGSLHGPNGETCSEAETLALIEVKD